MSKTSTFMEKKPVHIEGEKKLIDQFIAARAQTRQFGATAGGWAQTTIIRPIPK